MVGLTLKGMYKLSARISTGSNTQVYLARNLQTGNECAIKLLSPALAERSNFRRDFDHQFLSLKQLRHPHLISLHDWGMEHGCYFVVMDYIPGQTLHDRLALRGRLGLLPALNIALQVAEALRFSLEQRINPALIHPSSSKVLLNGRDNAVLLYHYSRPRSTPMLDPGRWMRRPFGRNAEGEDQAQRLLQSWCTALGAMLYEMLLGVPPLHSDTIASTLLNQSPPALQSLWPTRSDVPPAMDDIVTQLLTPEPGEHFTSLTEVIEILQELKAYVTAPEFLRSLIPLTDLYPLTDEEETLPVLTLPLLPRQKIYGEGDLLLPTRPMLTSLTDGQSFIIPGPSAVVGRRDPLKGIRPDVDLSSLERSVWISRRHVRISAEGAIYFIEDLQSTNRTYLNGQKLIPSRNRDNRYMLVNGDIVRLASVELRFDCE